MQKSLLGIMYVKAIANNVVMIIKKQKPLFFFLRAVVLDEC